MLKVAHDNLKIHSRKIINFEKQFKSDDMRVKVKDLSIKYSVILILNN